MSLLYYINLNKNNFNKKIYMFFFYIFCILYMFKMLNVNIFKLFIPTLVWVMFLFIGWYGSIVTCVLPLYYNETMRTRVLYEKLLYKNFIIKC